MTQNESWLFSEEENNFTSNEVCINYEDENIDIFSSYQLILTSLNENQIDDSNSNNFYENASVQNEKFQNESERNEKAQIDKCPEINFYKKKISKYARIEMKNWLMSHWFYPYPQKNVIYYFAQKYNLTPKQIHTFFVNHRSRLLNRKGWGSKNIVFFQ